MPHVQPALPCLQPAAPCMQQPPAEEPQPAGDAQPAEDSEPAEENGSEAETPEPEEAAEAEADSSGAELITHTVQAGEYLYTISQRYGVTIAEIMEWNRKTNDRLFAGEELIIYLPEDPAGAAE